MREDLSPRSVQVLDAIVERFIVTGQPVGSATVAGGLAEPVSSATVRNVMAELEATGYLEQPHTSAGRMPTVRGYRSYVGRLQRRRGSLRRIDEEGIKRQLCAGASEMAGLLQRACRLLSELSAQLGMVLAPPPADVAVQHLEFVRLRQDRALAVFVTRGGMVHSRTIELDEDLLDTDLEQAGRWLTERFAGRTLRQLRDGLREPAGPGGAAQRSALRLGARSLDDDIDQPEVLVQGTSRLLRSPDLADAEVLQSLVATVEERTVLGRLLTGFDGDGRPRVLIGSERLPRALAGCALIAAPYGAGERCCGVLGILGPKRMEYARAIPVVAAMARATSERLAELYA